MGIVAAVGIAALMALPAVQAGLAVPVPFSYGAACVLVNDDSCSIGSGFSDFASVFQGAGGFVGTVSGYLIGLESWNVRQFHCTSTVPASSLTCSYSGSWPYTGELTHLYATSDGVGSVVVHVQHV